MRLSEAIKLGSMLRPQAFGVFKGTGGTCAFSAALEAIGLLWADWNLRKLWPWLAIKVACPACDPVPLPNCYHHASVDSIILDLNDAHRWTRERIADWVATVEPAEVEAVAECPVLAEVAA